MHYLILILSLIQPVYALPFSITQAIKKRASSTAIFCIALAFAMISFKLIPSPDMDLSRHYERISSIKGLTFSDTFLYSEQGYLVFNSYAWLINSLDLPQEALTATVVFSAYYLMLKVFDSIKKEYFNSLKPYYIFIIFFTFLLSISLIGITSGLRNPLANIIVFYSFFRLLKTENIFLYFIRCIFAVGIHPAALIPIIITLTAYLFNGFLHKYAKTMVIIAIVLILANNIVTPIVQYLDSLANALPFYNSGVYAEADSHWGGGFKEHASASGILASLIGKFPVYISLTYLLLAKPKKRDILYLVACLCSLYLGVFYSYAILSGRLISFLIYVTSLIFAFRLATAPTKTFLSLSILYLSSLSIVICIQLYAYRDFFLTSIQSFYKPLLFIVAGI